MKKQKDNIKMVEEGFLVTFKDKSCSFIRTKNRLCQIRGSSTWIKKCQTSAHFSNFGRSCLGGFPYNTKSVGYWILYPRLPKSKPLAIPAGIPIASRSIDRFFVISLVSCSVSAVSLTSKTVFVAALMFGSVLGIAFTVSLYGSGMAPITQAPMMDTRIAPSAVMATFGSTIQYTGVLSYLKSKFSSMVTKN